MLLLVPAAGFLVSVLFAILIRSESKPKAAAIAQKTIGMLGFAVLAAVAIAARADSAGQDWTVGLFGQNFSFGITPLSWYFVAMISGITALTVFFGLQGIRDLSRYPMYYAWLFAKTFGMIGVVLARDLLGFFVLWEVMSWCTYFLLQQGKDALQEGTAAAPGARSSAAKKSAAAYLVYAVTASVILFAGVVYLYSSSGSFDFGAIGSTIAGFETGRLVLALVLMLVPFLVESAAYPFHWWMPPAYTNAETGMTSFLSAISTRIGIYAIMFFLYAVFGLTTLGKLAAGKYLSIQTAIMVIGALTMVIPTFTALFQHDAKQLMTWHSIGQGGYMLVGIASSTTLGVAGGLLHIFNYATDVSLILLSIAAVEYRTGTTNLNKLGGLIKKQPIAFLGLLFGIIGLAGIPPMNGFVSKWLIYRALILSGHPFIALSAFIATLGTILSVYKLIHNMFLGQLPERYDNVKEVGWGMKIPIILLMIVVWFTGIFPGTILSVVAEIQKSLGLDAIAFTLGGVAPEAGQLNMIVINITFISTLIVAFLLFLLGGKRKLVGQYDNYAAGHFLDKSVPYNFNYNFYSGFDHIFEHRFNNPPVKKTELGLAAFVRRMSDFSRRFYTGNVGTYAAYVVVAALAALIVAGGIR
jgi:NADH-quinone oxidoreductase subunit M